MATASEPKAKASKPDLSPTAKARGRAAGPKKAKGAKADPTPDPVQAATALHHKLISAQPKLDKVGVRLEKAVKAIVDGGDAAALPDLIVQVERHIAEGGQPEVMKSTNRRKAVELSDTDKAGIAEEASNRLKGKISHVKHTTDGNYVAVGQHGGDSFTLPRKLETKEFAEMARIGLPWAPAKKLADELIEKRSKDTPGHLARGIDAHNSPHSAKSVQDNRKAAGKGKPDPTPAKVAAKAKDEQRKADKAERAAPKGDDKRAITIVKKDFAFGKEGTSRRTSWDKCLKAKTVAAYIASGGAAKYLPRWASAGAIKLG